jgi:hypothetical protein
MSTSATEEGIILFSLGGPDIAFQESRAAYNNLDTHHPKAFFGSKTSFLCQLTCSKLAHSQPALTSAQ